MSISVLLSSAFEGSDAQTILYICYLRYFKGGRKFCGYQEDCQKRYDFICDCDPYVCQAMHTIFLGRLCVRYFWGDSVYDIFGESLSRGELSKNIVHGMLGPLLHLRVQILNRD